MRRFALAAPALLAAAFAFAAPRPTLAPPVQLTCDQQAHPLAVVSAHPQLGWILTASDPSERGLRQTAYRILASSSLQRLAAGAGDLWDSGRVAASDTLDIPYAGKPVAPEQQIYWKVEVWDAHGTASGWSAPATFTAAPARWTAQWIAATPAGSPQGTAEGVTQPMPEFRKLFDVHKPIARALLYVSGLGQDEVHLNGTKAGSRELAPGWTDYRKRVLYDSYNVTSLLRRGSNTITVLLGNGMFNVARTPGRYTKFVGTFGQPQCLLELHLVFRDGSTQTIATGPDWQSAPGPVTFSSAYGGEDYDARKLLPATGWQSAISVPGHGGQLQPEVTAPIHVAHVYHPVSRRQLPSGGMVYDLGQNFAGWPAISVRGEAGAEVRLIPGELLNPDGSVSQASANARPGRAQWYAYTLRGSGVERWHPLFSYYGFRYVQVQITGHAQLLALTGQAVYSSAEATGEFSSGIPLLNQIHVLILHSIENNMESVLTDCPHREKLGWLEESHLMGSALNYDFNLQRLYAKIESDMTDAQTSNGMVPTIAPQFTSFAKPWGVFDDSPEWGSAAVLDPWIAYRRYGDLETLRAQYPTMRRYVDYLTGRSHAGIVDYGLGDWYDIGPKAPGFAQLTSRSLTATGVYYQDILALAAAARVLGDTAEQARLETLRASVASAFQRRLYHSTEHYYDRDSQTANAMPLALGLVPPQDRAAVLEHLIADIRAHNNHVTAGDVGFHYVVDALLENGASDVLLDMLLRTDSPSYGYQLRQGATSLTEAWDASPHSSQDHLMLGHAEEWFYAGLGGIDIDFSRPVSDRILIRPAILPLVPSSTVLYRSVLGDISVSWIHQPQAISLSVVIPPNATAFILLPPTAQSSVREGHSSASSARGVSFVRMDGGSPVFRVASGHYHFSIPTSQDIAR